MAYDVDSVIKRWEPFSWQLSSWGKPTGYIALLPLSV